MNSEANWWNILEERSSSLFLVAGIILVVYGVANGIVTYTDVAVETSVLWFAYLFSFLGLLGLYPTLMVERPRLARVGAGAAVVGLLGVTLVSLMSAGQLAGIVSSPMPGLMAIWFLALVGFIGGYLAFGLAALRSDTYSTIDGLVLSVPGVIIVVMLLHLVAGLEQPWSVFVVSSGQAMAHLAIGATLRQQVSQPESEEQPDETPARATSDV
jgi:hypothetical protein